MGDIYRNAEEVIIWLGPAKPEYSKLWDQLKELGEFAAKGPIELNIDSFVDVNEEHSRMPSILELNLQFKEIFNDIRIGYGEHDTLLVEPLLHLLSRPWWSRMWVVQESALALIARVIWGSNEMYWGILWAALGYISTWIHFQSIHLMGHESYHEAFFLLEKSQPFWVPIVGAWERINRRLDGQTTKLIDMLLQTSVSSASTATDMRDNIYGLMGLIDDAEVLNISVDYSKSPEIVFEEIARALFRSEGIKVLQCCQYSELHRASHLPSWVPDWSCSLRLLLDGLKILLPEGVYNASGGGLVQSPFFEDLKPGMLKLSAARVDSILEVGYPWEESNDVLDCHLRDVLWVAELRRLGGLSSGIYSESVKREALWRTPIADRGLPRLTYIWYPRATESFSLGHDVLMEEFPLDNIGQDARLYWTERSRTYQKVLRAFGQRRRLFVTCAGLLGIGPDSAQAGDVVYVIPGTSTPFILRRKAKNKYQIIGEAYVHGIMDGEYMRRNPSITTLNIC